MSLPPPPKRLPPPRRASLPPRRSLPEALPQTDRVKIVPDPAGGYMVVTKWGFVVGRRLDKQRGIYPDGIPTRAIPSIVHARVSMLVWDKFITDQETKKK